ncbi:MAG: hypothetical protein EBZ66_05275, partial [Actinobacteria bacterium]|nr:hypothetical protein [Actinomycetota bacterium]
AAPQQSAPQEKKADASPSSGGAPSTQTAQTETKADAKPTARQEIQANELRLPLLPTTTIGSF